MRNPGRIRDMREKRVKPMKYTPHQAKIIDLGTKVIYKYPTPTGKFDVGRMVVDGRHPAAADAFIVEHACSFIMYVTKGSGRVFAGDDVFDVLPEDVVFVPAEHQFAIEGTLEYITFDSPAFYPEQSEEVKAAKS
jgi:mannose-6-phosphate isomerase-like protein (cupin superfamily)